MTTPEPLPPVPSPPAHLWRQFRVKVIPALTCVTILVATVWLWGRNLANPLVMEPAALRNRGMVANQEHGLPVLIRIPKDMCFVPGEMADIRLLLN